MPFFEKLFGSKPKPAPKGGANPYEPIADMGDIIAKYPNAILDVSILPRPKQEMKNLMKFAFATVEDPALQEHTAAGFLLLANFQEGVGPTPITLEMPRSVTGDMSGFERWNKRNEKSTAEMKLLSAEWKRYLAGEPI